MESMALASHTLAASSYFDGLSIPRTVHPDNLSQPVNLDLAPWKSAFCRIEPAKRKDV